MVVYSDGWGHDYAWLAKLFDAAGMRAQFRLEHLRVLLDETWYLDPDDDAARLTRLIARHERFGRTPEAARAHAIGSDQRNARLVAATRDRADLVVHWRTAG